jgi:hypothetical protein
MGMSGEFSACVGRRPKKAEMFYDKVNFPEFPTIYRYIIDADSPSLSPCFSGCEKRIFQQVL